MTTPSLDLADIQGIILRGYTLGRIRHLNLRINDAAGAKRFLAGLVSGEETVSPQITTAAPWKVKPPYCLQLGLTFAGLQALGLAQEVLASFPPEFQQGPAVRAEIIGDVDENAPENWIGGFAPQDGKPSEAHLLLILYARDDEVREDISARLRALFGRQGAMTEISTQDGAELPESRVHFGYVDGLSQPRVEGGPTSRHVGLQPPVPPGEFLVGYPSQYAGYTYPIPGGLQLSRNGSYFAYRIFRQDVVGFEKFLETAGQANGVDKEFIAAKMCGRWRNGVPIELSPETDTPNPPIPRQELNDFDYVPSPDYPGAYNDWRGQRCPISSHIRRSFPRSQMVAGGGGKLRRIIRRAMPYGPVYRPEEPYDGKERGLLMMVVCVSLADQFEFLMSQWVNGSIFAAGVSGKDPVLGSNEGGSGVFTYPQQNGPPVQLTGLSRFVVTRGSAYGFLPGIAGLKYLSSAD